VNDLTLIHPAPSQMHWISRVLPVDITLAGSSTLLLVYQVPC